MRTIRTATAGLVLAVSLAAGSVGLAGAASAASAQPGPPHVKAYPTWQAAQKAAGFQLLKPANTVGLRRHRGILVVGCPRPSRAAQSRHRTVLAMYGALPRPRRLGTMINFVQRGATRGPCPGPFRGPRGKVIARVKVDGAIAVLTRAHASVCFKPVSGRPRCRSVELLQLRWTAHRHSYLVMGLRLRPARVIRFARSLVPVG
ncbi:MAG TPA: hypothetical protein VN840_03110 [Streptosporangiaceae bacterium]|nr:hypothetical protein [Streptosporangiaceae bacterium]